MTMIHFYMVIGNNREHEQTVYHIWSTSVASVCVCVCVCVCMRAYALHFNFITFNKTCRMMIVCHCYQKCGG